MPMKRIAARLGVSPGTVHLWTADIPISSDHEKRNSRWSRVRFVESWRNKHRQRRLGYQQEGRQRARAGDTLHTAGAMLYWAEGSKSRNTVQLTNSDPEMLRFFRRFLVESLDVSPADLRIRLNVYLGNGLALKQIEDHWLQVLDLPNSSLRGHSINHFPTSSSGRKKNRLPFGVCTLSVARSTWAVQHIYGAIQEYAGFEEPRWLDCDPGGGGIPSRHEPG
jgi:hypothetical protein